MTLMTSFLSIFVKIRSVIAGKNWKWIRRQDDYHCWSTPPFKTHKTGKGLKGLRGLASDQLLSNSVHGCRGEVKIVSANQRPNLLCLLAYKLEKYTPGRGHWRFASLMRNCFPRRPLGAPLHTFVKIIWSSRWFLTHPLFLGCALLYLSSPKCGYCSISDDLPCSCHISFGSVRRLRGINRKCLSHTKRWFLTFYHVPFISVQWFQKKKIENVSANHRSERPSLRTNRPKS